MYEKCLNSKVGKRTLDFTFNATNNLLTLNY